MEFQREDEFEFTDEFTETQYSALWELAKRGARIAIDENKPRLRFYSGLTGFLCAVVVMIPVSILFYNNAKTNSSNLSRTNCHQASDARPQGNARVFVEAEIAKIADEAFNNFPAKFKNQEDARIAADARAEAKFAPGQHLEQVHSFAGLAAILHNIPLINCRNATH